MTERELQSNPHQPPTADVGAARLFSQDPHFPEGEPDLIEIGRRLLKHRRAFLLAPLASTFLFVGIWVFVPPLYRASTSFVSRDITSPVDLVRENHPYLR